MNTTTGAIEFAITVPGAGSRPTGIAYNPVDGILYFTERGSDEIARIGTGGGVVLETAVAGTAPTDIAAASDGHMWFTEEGSDQVARATTGAVVITQFSVPGAPQGIASGAGAGAPLWFTMPPTDTIGQITTAGARTSPSHCRFPGTDWADGTEGPTGPTGPEGPTGPTGPTGSQGPAGTSRLVVVAFSVLPFAPAPASESTCGLL